MKRVRRRWTSVVQTMHVYTCSHTSPAHKTDLCDYIIIIYICIVFRSDKYRHCSIVKRPRFHSFLKYLDGQRWWDRIWCPMSSNWIILFYEIPSEMRDFRGKLSHAVKTKLYWSVVLTVVHDGKIMRHNTNALLRHAMSIMSLIYDITYYTLSGV